CAAAGTARDRLRQEDSPMPLSDGEVISGYTISRRLGSGGMGESSWRSRSRAVPAAAHPLDERTRLGRVHDLGGRLAGRFT
ncbi:hypothetical protein C6A85_09050, partial [Mycobacterium sp. ITM-2017-0098]